MEIADIFVVNKSDRPGADAFVKNLRLMLAPAFLANKPSIPIIKTIASQREGLSEVAQKIKEYDYQIINEKKYWLLTEKAWYLIQAARMKDLDKKALKAVVEQELQRGTFNLYNLAARYFLQ
jgi:LAO/AO transport system kinase